MDVKFDANAATELISQMNMYCAGVLQETRELVAITNNTDGWNDNQTKAFKNNVKELNNDLKTALSLEKDYMKTFQQRVKELRG